MVPPRSDSKLPKIVRIALVLAVLYLLANLLYAAKSLSGVDLDGKGSHGALFPLGNWIYESLGGKHGEKGVSDPQVPLSAAKP